MDNQDNQDQTKDNNSTIITGAQMKPGVVDPRHLVVPKTPQNGDMFYSDGTVFKKIAPGTTGQILTMSGGVPTWKSPYNSFSGARMTENGTSITTGGTATLAFPSETFDTDNYHDNTTNNSRFTLPATGKYILGGEFFSNVTQSNGLLDIGLLVNGSSTISFFRAQNLTGQVGVPLFRMIQGNIGQYYEVAVTQFSGFTMTPTVEFWIYRIG